MTDTQHSSQRLAWAATTLRAAGYRQIAYRLALDVGFTEPAITPIADGWRAHRARMAAIESASAELAEAV